MDMNDRVYGNSKGGPGGDTWFQPGAVAGAGPVGAPPGMNQMGVRGDVFMLDNAMLRGDSRVMYPFPNSPLTGPAPPVSSNNIVMPSQSCMSDVMRYAMM